MTPDRWTRIEEIVDRAMSCDPGRRAGLVDEACCDDRKLRDEVMSLLSYADRSESFLGSAVVSATKLFDHREALGDGAEVMVGERVGVYEIVRMLASGGMGTVYLAKRVDEQFESQVAIKIIKKGMDSQEILRRFRIERQLLAHLSHENIARLLDGGTTGDGRPYLVMEYIDGRRIDRFCDDGRLSIRQRLGLFRRVMKGVQFAHQRLVVHRDLKPGNILVTDDGTPKLLDFGIAKLLDPERGELTGDTSAQPMTPDYASPEQLRGQAITTSSDVYSLGVVLYELLCGRKLYDRRMVAGVRSHGRTGAEESDKGSGLALNHMGDDCRDVAAMRDTTPDRLRRELSGDLQNIVSMSTRAEPDRRYSSVEQLDEDVRRYLGGLPISARRDSVGYRVGKYVRRNKLLLTGVVVVVLSVLTGLTTTMLQVRIARNEKEAADAARIAEASQREAAEEHLLLAENVTEFLVDLFEISDPNEAMGQTVTAREILDRGSLKIDRQLSNQPQLQARLMDTMGRVYINLGLYGRASELVTGSLSLRESAFGRESVEAAESINRLGEIAFYQGDYDRAERLHGEALDTRKMIHGGRHPQVAESLNDLGMVMFWQGEHDVARGLLEEALEQRRYLLGALHSETVESVLNVAGYYRRAGQYDEAERRYKHAIETLEELRLSDHTDMAVALFNLAAVFKAKGMLDESESRLRAALGIWTRLHGESHPLVATCMSTLAGVLKSQGNLVGARELYQSALDMRYRLLANDHPDIALGHNNLASLLYRMKLFDLAEPHFRQSHSIWRDRLGVDHPKVATALRNIANTLIQKGRVRDAIVPLEQSLAIEQRQHSPDEKRIARTLETLAKTFMDTDQAARAEGVLRESLLIRSGASKPDANRIAATRGLLAECLMKLGRSEEADLLVEEQKQQNRE